MRLSFLFCLALVFEVKRHHMFWSRFASCVRGRLFCPGCRGLGPSLPPSRRPQHVHYTLSGLPPSPRPQPSPPPRHPLWTPPASRRDTLLLFHTPMRRKSGGSRRCLESRDLVITLLTSHDNKLLGGENYFLPSMYNN